MKRSELTFADAFKGQMQIAKEQGVEIHPGRQFDFIKAANLIKAAHQR